MDLINEKLLLLKQLGLTAEELSTAKAVSENLDAVFLKMKEKFSINDDTLGKMFSVFFSSEFPKIMKEKEVELQMMEEDKNEPAITDAVAKMYSEVFVRFCEKNDNVGLEEAKIFKENFIKLFPTVMKLQKDSPAGLESFFKQTGGDKNA